jgi:hypothetical protein
MSIEPSEVPTDHAKYRAMVVAGLIDDAPALEEETARRALDRREQLGETVTAQLARDRAR